MRKSIILVIILAAFVYIGGIAYFTSHFLPNTYINGEAVGLKSDTETEMLIKPETPSDISIIDRDGNEEVIELTSINFEIKNKKTASQMIDEQKRVVWPLALFSKKNINLEKEINYDNEQLRSVVNQLSVVKNQVLPTDARIENTENGYELIPSSDGNAVDYDKMISLIETAIKEHKAIVDLQASDCYQKAKIHEDDPELVERMKKIDAFVSKTITIDMTDAEELIDRKVLSDFITADGEPDYTDEDIREYVDELCKKYETYQTERPFKTSDGKEIKVGGGADDTYGFWMDRDATAERIKEAIKGDKDVTITPEWKVWSIARNRENGDIGDTYVEVSKEKQHLWYYKKGKLELEADVITGLPTPDRDTPVGLFRILLKDTEHTMHGSYGTAFCHYWLACTWQGVGIHDATWQSGFGGERYKTVGSHGCVNVSLDTAKTLYGMIDNNTPVVIY